MLYIYFILWFYTFTLFYIHLPAQTCQYTGAQTRFLFGMISKLINEFSSRWYQTGTTSIFCRFQVDLAPEGNVFYVLLLLLLNFNKIIIFIAPGGERSQMSPGKSLELRGEDLMWVLVICSILSSKVPSNTELNFHYKWVGHLNNNQSLHK